jgi:hypothetical protein
MDADWADGPDSEEIISGLVESHGNRNAVATIRAALQGNHKLLRELASHVNTTLLLLLDGDEDGKCVEQAYSDDDFPKHTPLAEGEYSSPEQFQTGDNGPKNELFPTGEMDEPERGIDALFWPPLLWAARNQDAPTCRVLLEIGADPNFVTPAGMTAVRAVLLGANLYTQAKAAG